MARANEIFDYKEKSTDENGVLKNKLEITNEDDLEKAERMITAHKLLILYLKDEENKFDVDHYLSIHKFLFEDIYEFAGQIRDEVINKRIPFCLPQFIYDELKRVLRDSNKKINYISNREELLSFITELYSDLDVIHPFREGNGRTEREFIRQYINHICKINNLPNYCLDYDQVDKLEMENAVVKADAMLDYRDLYNIFDNILIIKEKENTKHL